MPSKIVQDYDINRTNGDDFRLLNLLKVLASDAFKLYADAEFSMTQKLKILKMQKQYINR